MSIVPAIESSAPDWSTISFHPLCPLCDYDLYGSQTPRCSECGYPFVWSEMLNPHLQKHPYLFEQHPEANVWSYWTTLKNTFRAKSFWSQLHPTQRPVTKRLILFWSIGAFAFLMGVVIECVVLRFRYTAYRFGLTRGISISDLLDFGFASRYVGSARFLRDVTVLGIFPLAIPWLTWFTLLIFRVSMLRARVSPKHVLRSVLYSLDPSSWLIVVFLSCLFAIATLVDPSFMRWWSLGLCVLLWSPIIVMSAYRLWIAYLVYLRFDHALATVCAAGCIVALIVINVFYKLTLR